MAGQGIEVDIDRRWDVTDPQHRVVIEILFDDGTVANRQLLVDRRVHAEDRAALDLRRSEEHTSELQSLMRISYAVFCLKKKRHQPTNDTIIVINIHKDIRIHIKRILL